MNTHIKDHEANRERRENGFDIEPKDWPAAEIDFASQVHFFVLFASFVVHLFVVRAADANAVYPS
jgi:hypothetical protein